MINGVKALIEAEKLEPEPVAVVEEEKKVE